MYECYVDGSYRPEGSAAAVVIYRYRKEVLTTVKPVPSQSSMAAECEAVMMAVMLCHSHNYPHPTIYTDSKNLYDHFNGKTKVKNKNMAFYIFALKQLEKNFPFILERVSRKDVAEPDALCKNFILDAHHYYENARKGK